jgi:hypothetical protein
MKMCSTVEVDWVSVKQPYTPNPFLISVVETRHRSCENEKTPAEFRGEYSTGVEKKAELTAARLSKVP